VATDHDADETAFVARFEDGFVALVGGQAGLDDDFLYLVGREIFKQADLLEEEAFQVNFTHAVSRFDRVILCAKDYHFVAPQQSVAITDYG